ncbi:MAG: redoxin domain-containing protein [Dehalococcoidia bacterium]
MTQPNEALTPRSEPLEVNDAAPLFVLPAITTDGEQFDVNLAEWIARGTTMLVFYQDDGMPICTSELKAFAQEFETLDRAGIQVLGINSNGLGSHTKFQERDHFPFALISDFHGEAIKAYGMWDPDENKSRRGVVVIGADGRVMYVLPHFNPGAVSTFAKIFQALGLA